MQRQSWVVPPCAFGDVSRAAGGKQEEICGDDQVLSSTRRGCSLWGWKHLVAIAKSATKMKSKKYKDGGLVKTNIYSGCDAPEQLKTGLRWLILTLKCEHTNPGL